MNWMIGTKSIELSDFVKSQAAFMIAMAFLIREKKHIKSNRDMAAIERRIQPIIFKAS